jgi:hypothetical protein
MLFNARSCQVRDAIKASRLPFAEDEVEWYIAEHVAMEVASSSWYFHPRTTIVFCDNWEAAAQSGSTGTIDKSYLVIRAVAHLRIGDFDAADRDVQEAIRQKAVGQLRLGGLEDLQIAVQQKNRDFIWRSDDSSWPERGWLDDSSK